MNQTPDNQTKVRRYYSTLAASMHEAPSGPYVLFSDYKEHLWQIEQNYDCAFRVAAELRAKLATLEAEVQKLREFKNFVDWELLYNDSGGTRSQKAILGRIRAALNSTAGEKAPVKPGYPSGGVLQMWNEASENPPEPTAGEKGAHA